MSKKEYPVEFMEKIKAITAKRPKTVVNHIMENGYITSDELKNIYGYNHPPRAVRDVRELGIPIETYRVKNNEGKSIAAYKFGNIEEFHDTVSKSYGRTVLSKYLKQALIEKYGTKCFVYMESIDEKLLQVDHRVPYEIDGEQNQDNIENFMLLSPSANRMKSWSCEHCVNWLLKDRAYCVKCFWAYPEKYNHIAGKNERAVNILFTDDEIEVYDALIKACGKVEVQRKIKAIINAYLLKK